MRCIIAGSGISGAVLARELAEKGNKVVVYERRDHIGGNLYDYVDEHGYLVHKYGPHIFHTDDEGVYQYVTRYTEWSPFKLECGAVWDGRYTVTPFNFHTIDTFFEEERAERIKKKIKERLPGRETATVVELLEHPDDDIRGFASYLFEKDYAPYTAKQWGISPHEISPDVLKRVPIRLSYATGYFNDKYEMMPAYSYTRLIQNILDHRDIVVETGIDVLDHVRIWGTEIYWDGVKFEGLFVYTGALDELFAHQYGELPYRSLRFEWRYSDMDSYQEAPVVAYPQEKGFTRITEYKKLSLQKGTGTSYAVEYPYAYKESEKMEPYYPVPTAKSQEQYARYKDLADQIPQLVVCGRLAEFKYYDMDQAIKNALKVADDPSN